ncbi:hypothetical protein HanPI659440_Chr03g0115611 [Helianthus annuus]|nr:hypothetical protein HanPI659440_Chr03g0115611 [Helianthus annuus]
MQTSNFGDLTTMGQRPKTVKKCESQIEASWTALKAWKSGYKVT